MKTKKITKITAFIMVIMMIAMLLPVYSYAATVTVANVGTFTYTTKYNSTLKRYEATITAFAPLNNVTDVEIPEIINGNITVTAIGNGDNNNDGIIEGNSTITKIIIPKTVTTIYPHAFQYSFALKTVQILSPSKLTKIGAAAFINCSALESINLPEGLLEIGNEAFRACSSLKSITIPSTVTAIGNKAFYGCKKLTNVIIKGNPRMGTDVFPSTVTPTYDYTTPSTEAQTDPVTEASTEATTQATTQATTKATETTTEEQSVEMPTEKPTEPTTFIYDNNGFAGYYDYLGQYVEVYQPCEYDSETNMFKITNAGNLYWFADYINSDLGMESGAGAMLMNDITDNEGVMDGTNNNVRKWTPIGASGGNGHFSFFYGTFEGNNHIISGLYCDTQSDSPLPYAGLFGYVSGNGTISNVCVVNSYFNANLASGAVVGALSGTVSNCLSADNKFTANINAGGIAGVIDEVSHVTGCHCMDSTIDISFNENSVYFGNGIVGQNAGTTLFCFFRNVKVTKAAGGSADVWEGVTEIPNGDVTLDGKVDMMDAIAVQTLQYAKYSIVSRSADIDGNSIINAADTANILKIIASKESTENTDTPVGADTPAANY